MGRRIPRLNEQLKREITDILQNGVRDPRIGFVTITHVEVAPDLSFARVFASVMGDERDKAVSMEGLAAAAPFIRTELGKRLHVRRVPELRFDLDRTLEHAMRIEKLLHEALPPAAPQEETGEREGEHADEDAAGREEG